jgi:hypothetical protein
MRGRVVEGKLLQGHFVCQKYMGHLSRFLLKKTVSFSMADFVAGLQQEFSRPETSNLMQMHFFAFFHVTPVVMFIRTKIFCSVFPINHLLLCSVLNFFFYAFCSTSRSYRPLSVYLHRQSLPFAKAV